MAQVYISIHIGDGAGVGYQRSPYYTNNFWYSTFMQLWGVSGSSHQSLREGPPPACKCFKWSCLAAYFTFRNGYPFSSHICRTSAAVIHPRGCNNASKSSAARLPAGRLAALTPTFIMSLAGRWNFSRGQRPAPPAHPGRGPQ